MLKRLWNKAVKLQEQRANYWKLRNMTDRELKDHGKAGSYGKKMMGGGMAKKKPTAKMMYGGMAKKKK